jgi:hypothetical protein
MHRIRRHAAGCKQILYRALKGIGVKRPCLRDTITGRPGAAVMLALIVATIRHDRPSLLE